MGVTSSARGKGCPNHSVGVSLNQQSRSLRGSRGIGKEAGLSRLKLRQVVNKTLSCMQHDLGQTIGGSLLSVLGDSKPRSDSPHCKQKASNQSPDTPTLAGEYFHPLASPSNSAIL